MTFKKKSQNMSEASDKKRGRNANSKSYDTAEYDKLAEKRRMQVSESENKPRKRKISHIIFTVLTVIKSLFSLVSLGLMAAAFCIWNESLFGMFLLIVMAVFIGISYVFSVVCLLVNFFKVKRYGKVWSLCSCLSLLFIMTVLLVSVICGGIESGSTYLFCACSVLQCIPSVIEIYTFEKKMMNRK